MVLARDGGVVFVSMKFKGWMGLRASVGVNPTTLPAQLSYSGTRRQRDSDQKLSRRTPQPRQLVSMKFKLRKA